MVSVLHCAKNCANSTPTMPAALAADSSTEPKLLGSNLGVSLGVVRVGMIEYLCSYTSTTLARDFALSASRAKKFLPPLRAK